jgi:hypothetical protein
MIIAYHPSYFYPQTSRLLFSIRFGNASATVLVSTKRDKATREGYCENNNNWLIL